MSFASCLTATAARALLLRRSLQYRRELRNLALDKDRHRRRPAPALVGDGGAEIGEPLVRDLVVEGLVERGGERVDYRRRRALGREQGEERRGVELRQALL